MDTRWRVDYGWHQGGTKMEGGLRRILIANRGECALRIIRTCKKLDLESVAIYTEEDVSNSHYKVATESAKVASYTDIEDIIRVCEEFRCDGVHPGYGFLSENADFAQAICDAGFKWIGPTPNQIRDFGEKTQAIAIAKQFNVPVSPSSPIICNGDWELGEEYAKEIGYPVLIKPVGGGGGIGMQICNCDADIAEKLPATHKLAKRHFGDGRVFLEKYVEKVRHIEVQVFGDGTGNVYILGERECSMQRRFQKVIEEAPSPALTDLQREYLFANVAKMMQGVRYESAGTVEFLYDDILKKFYFLEVNTRLQVEHGVTEEVAPFPCDLVEWMIRQVTPETRIDLTKLQKWKPNGSAIQVRVYAEATIKDFRPCSGIMGQFFIPTFMEGLRVETWLYCGARISPSYDPMIAKIIQRSFSRFFTIQKLIRAIDCCKVKGVANNLKFLKSLLQSEFFQKGETYVKSIESHKFENDVVEVIEPGMNTTIQDYPGRTRQGLWRIGIPPSGPMDHLNFRIANRLVGNKEEAAGLEITLKGPCLKFYSHTCIAVAGANFNVSLNTLSVPMFTAIKIKPGDILEVGTRSATTGTVVHGVRCYIAIRGGLDVPQYLGSRSTFVTPSIGGLQGRALVHQDTIPIGEDKMQSVFSPNVLNCLPNHLKPQFSQHWDIGVLPGPMAQPDYLTEADIEMLYSTRWEVHHNSNRMGIRLSGPSPSWARADGGEGGSHPSNIHDCVYAIGTINFTGNMPIIIAQDGPSLGGFVCPCTIVSSELWKIGQLKPNDTVTFKCLTIQEAVENRMLQDAMIESIGRKKGSNNHNIKEIGSIKALKNLETKAVLVDIPASSKGDQEHPGMKIRLAGDKYIMIEYGQMVLDLKLRMRIHILERGILEKGIIGVEETAPGVRSLQVRYDCWQIDVVSLCNIIYKIDAQIEDVAKAQISSRILHLPLAWETSGVKEALQLYQKSVRSEAPYLPRNIDFIGENNGIDTDEVYKKVMRASYMCMGLGDVYLGACCAVPVDPRDRLVVPKFNPARYFTQEGTVGLGGAYMCIYPMNSPGGYQLIGRTLPIWDTFAISTSKQFFTPQKPWMLEMFDQIRFFPCSEQELDVMRSDFKRGVYTPKMEYEIFDLAKHTEFVEEISEEINAFTEKQRSASKKQNILEQESLERLEQRNMEDKKKSQHKSDMSTYDIIDPKSKGTHIKAHLTAKVWEILVKSGDDVKKGDTLMILEAMKMQSPIVAPMDGRIGQISCEEETFVTVGSTLLLLADDEEVITDNQFDQEVDNDLTVDPKKNWTKFNKLDLSHTF